MALLIVSAPAFAEKGAVDQAIDEQQAAAFEKQNEGILPVPDYSGDFWTRSNLTGDWGEMRTHWAKRGFTLDLQWYQAVQGVASGGVKERTTYGTNLDLYVHLDLMRMGLLPGAVINFRAQSRPGRRCPRDRVLLQLPSGPEHAARESAR